MAISNITVTDASNENSSFSVQAAALTSGNIVAQTGAAGTLATATQNLIIGSLVKQTIVQVLTDTPDTPTNPFAQRELKWLVTYQSVTSGHKWQIEIPTPDLGNSNLVEGTDIADLTSTAWDAWVTAFVAYAKAPDDITDSVIVIGARLVGRNL